MRIREITARWLLSAAVLLTGASGVGRPQDNADLRTLIEMQGKQLQEQARALEEQRKQIELLQQRLEASPVPVETNTPTDNTATAPPLNDQAVRKIVSDYLDDKQKQDREKKEKEEKDKAEKKKLEAEEFQEVGKDLTLKTTWNNGFLAETADKAFKFHLGGRFQYDTGFYYVPTAVQSAMGRSQTICKTAPISGVCVCGPTARCGSKWNGSSRSISPERRTCGAPTTLRTPTSTSWMPGSVGTTCPSSTSSESGIRRKR